LKTSNEIRKNWNLILENFRKGTLKEFRSRVNEEDFGDMEDSEGGKLSPELAAKINAELKGQTIKNSETDNDIQVASALGYDKGTAVYKDAKKVFDKALEKVTGKQKSGAPDSEPAEEEPGKLSGDDFKSAAEKDQEPSSGASSSDDELAKAKANQEKALQLIKKNAPHLLDPEYQKDAEADLAAEPDSQYQKDAEADLAAEPDSQYNKDAEADLDQYDSDSESDDSESDDSESDDWWNQDPDRYKESFNKFGNDLAKLINEIDKSVK